MIKKMMLLILITVLAVSVQAGVKKSAAPVQVISGSQIEGLIGQVDDLAKQAVELEEQRKKRQEELNTDRELQQVYQEQQSPWWDVPARWRAEEVQQKLQKMTGQIEEIKRAEDRAERALQQKDRELMEKALSYFEVQKTPEPVLLNIYLSKIDGIESREGQRIRVKLKQISAVIPSVTSSTSEERGADSAEQSLIDSTERKIEGDGRGLLQDLLKQKMANIGQLLGVVKSRFSYLERKQRIFEKWLRQKNFALGNEVISAQSQTTQEKNWLDHEVQSLEALFLQMNKILDH